MLAVTCRADCVILDPAVLGVTELVADRLASLGRRNHGGRFFVIDLAIEDASGAALGARSRQRHAIDHSAPGAVELELAGARGVVLNDAAQAHEGVAEVAT